MFVIMVTVGHNGLTLYGPFETEAEAVRYGEAEIGAPRWWLVVPVKPK
jgi:hypothetical protein